MGNIPVLKPQEVIRILEGLGLRLRSCFLGWGGEAIVFACVGVGDHVSAHLNKAFEFDDNLLSKVAIAFGIAIMAKLSLDISETVWRLKRQLADVINNARAAEFFLFNTFGETERTIFILMTCKALQNKQLNDSPNSQAYKFGF
jgi:hypothetical protein